MNLYAQPVLGSEIVELQGYLRGDEVRFWVLPLFHRKVDLNRAVDALFAQSFEKIQCRVERYGSHEGQPQALTSPPHQLAEKASAYVAYLIKMIAGDHPGALVGAFPMIE